MDMSHSLSMEGIWYMAMTSPYAVDTAQMIPRRPVMLMVSFTDSQSPLGVNSL